jgi:hypothetical protein
MATMGDVMVGGRFEPPEGNPGLWRSRRIFLCYICCFAFDMKSSRIIGILLLVVALSVAAWLLFEKPETARPTAQVIAAPAANELPKMNVLSLPEESTLALNSLSGNVVLIFFNPSCKHCQEEAELIAGNKDLFESYQLYFIASDSTQTITKFAADYDLTEPNYHFAFGDGLSVYQTMGAINNVPAVFVYRDRKLTGKSEGMIALEKWKELL